MAVHPDDLKIMLESFESVSKDQGVFESTSRILNSSGDYRWHLWRSVPLRDEKECVTWIGTATGIHTQKLNEEKLEQAELMAKLGNYEFHPITGKLFFSAGMFRLFGLAPNAVEPTLAFIDSISHVEDAERIRIIIDKSLRTQSSYEYIRRIYLPSGEMRYLLGRGRVVPDLEGNPARVFGIVQDITEQVLAEQSLKEQNHFIKQITATSPDLILVFDMLHNRAVYLNKDVSFLGHSKDEFQQLSLQDIQTFVHPDDWEEFFDYYNNYKDLDDEDINEIEYRVCFSREECRWLKERGRVFQRDQSGKVQQFIAIVQDATDKKESEERQKENELLLKLIEKRDEFMSIASHELKTPLTTLKASLQVLQRLVESERDHKTLAVFAAQANISVNKVLSLISDLMDKSRIQSGKLNLNVEELSMGDIINDTVRNVNSSSHSIIIRNHVPDPFQGDKIRLEQVLTNFLSNAIKYSPGSREVLIEATKDDGRILVQVTDYGIGIPKDKINYIFDRFYRVESKSQEFSGLGLGLYIAAEIILKHHGEYGVRSEVGQGSTFWFSIPAPQKGN